MDILHIYAKRHLGKQLDHRRLTWPLSTWFNRAGETNERERERKHRQLYKLGNFPPALDSRVRSDARGSPDFKTLLKIIIMRLSVRSTWQLSPSFFPHQQIVVEGYIKTPASLLLNLFFLCFFFTFFARS